MPGDSLLSRVHNEVSKRLLHITQVARVKGVEDERRVSQKRKESGGGLSYTVGPQEVDAKRPNTIDGHLDGLEMYLLALSVVGCAHVDPLPQVEQGGQLVNRPETKEDKPEDYSPVGRQLLAQGKAVCQADPRRAAAALGHHSR